MNKEQRKRLEALFSLLDEQNSKTANIIIADLLNSAENIAPFLLELQESDDPLIRKRIHQIQSILSIRERRKNFAESLKNSSISLLEGLVEIHLQWYDSDSPHTIMETWNELFGEFKKIHCSSIDQIAYFMRKVNFSVTERNGLIPDSYCLGLVIEDKTGVDLILCAIVKCLAQQLGLQLSVIKMIDGFALADEAGAVLSPMHNWRIYNKFNHRDCKVWNDQMILKLMSARLFLCAVGSDSFRYINTIGNVLAEIIGEKKLSFLPFPYDSKGSS